MPCASDFFSRVMSNLDKAMASGENNFCHVEFSSKSLVFLFCQANSIACAPQ